MRAGLITSAAAHSALILFGLLSLGATPLEPEIIESIAVDLVPVSAFSNIREGTLDSEVIETETPAVVESETPPELARPTGNTAEDQPTPQDTPTPSPAPAVNTAPEPVPEPTPEPEPIPEPEPAPAPAPAPEPKPAPAPVPEPEPAPAPAPAPEPAPAPVPAPTPTPELAVEPVTETPAVVAPQPVARTAALDQRRAQYKQQAEAAEQARRAAAAQEARAEAERREAALRRQEEAREADDISDIINNEDSRGADTGEGGQPTVGKPTGQAATLTQAEKAALVAQIRACMSVPPGSLEAGVTAKLQFSIGADGSLRGDPQIVEQGDTTLAVAFARAARRAVMQCGPYTVAAGQDVLALFDPREFL